MKYAHLYDSDLKTGWSRLPVQNNSGSQFRSSHKPTMRLHPNSERHCFSVQQPRGEQEENLISHSAPVVRLTQSSRSSQRPSFTGPWPANAEHTLSYLIQQCYPIWMLKWGHFNFRVTLHSAMTAYHNITQSTQGHLRRGERKQKESIEKAREQGDGA